jgi:hypothetical protein
MIQSVETISEIEHPRQVRWQAAMRQFSSSGRRIEAIEGTEQRLSVRVAPSSTRLASGEGFITDWADS